MDLLNAGDFGQLFFQAAVAAFAVDLHLDEGGQPLAEGDRVQPDLIAFDDALLLQLADALQHRRGRHADLSGYLGVGDSGFFLKNVQYLKVNIVDCSVNINHV